MLVSPEIMTPFEPVACDIHQSGGGKPYGVVSADIADTRYLNTPHRTTGKIG